MNTKLLAIDMDDTLLTSDLDISAANKAAVRAVRAAGCQVVLASGRSLGGLRSYARELGLDGKDDYLISQNGAELSSGLGTAVHRQLRLSPEIVEQVYDWSAERGLSLHATDGRRIVASKDNPWSREDSRLTSMPLDIVDKAHFAAETLPKLVVNGEPAQLEQEEDFVRARWKGLVLCYRSKPFFMEILPIGADKAHALEELAARLGIAQEHTAAIGDSWNDLGMLRWAGTGIAVANAVPEALAAADKRTQRDHNADAVAEAIYEVLGFAKL